MELWNLTNRPQKIKQNILLHKKRIDQYIIRIYDKSRRGKDGSEGV